MKKIIPFLVLGFVVFILTRSLFFSKPNEIPSPLINQSVPTFTLTTLGYPYGKFNEKELTGGVKLLTFWATWCDACDAEHKMLLKIKNQFHISIYGVLYKDNADDAITYLKNNGNPFVKVGDDNEGNVGIDFGVYATPETFIIGRDGKILYKQIGAISEKTWNETLLPIIEKNNK